MQTFEQLAVRDVPSLAVRIQEYRHRPTGARHFHVASDDPNNVFLVALPTVPQDSTGVAHILEHTALCGSRRYPVRDPFFLMIRRSLNTFMNAFTSSDATVYPFASQNRKDFDNLMAVYLDAVFFPRLDELDFAQEGHRLEFADPRDPESPLVHRGVVYNEMKGAMSSPSARLWQDLYAALFPTTTYHFNSGGEPGDIPDLGYAQLKAFHESHYHPSQAVFMTYGSFPVEEHQRNMEELALSAFSARPAAFEIGDERRLAEPILAETRYAVDGEDVEGRTHIVLGWLWGHSFELRALLEAYLLSGILLDTGASPLRRLLETSELGSAPSELCGLDDSSREMVFICGLEGTEPEAGAPLRDAVFATLGELADHGVDPALVRGVLERLELAQRDLSGGGQPYGLQLLGRLLPPALHGGDVLGFLDIDEELERLRRSIEEPGFVAALLRRWLLDNPHWVCMTMIPEPGRAQREAAGLAGRLAEVKAALSQEQRGRIVEQAEALRRRQQQVDDVDILPKVGLEDVPASRPRPEGVALEKASRPLTWFSQGTNGVTHQQLIVPLPALDADETALLPIYVACLLEVGCGRHDYLAMQVRQGSLGQLSVNTLARARVEALDALRGYLVLYGKSLTRHQAALAELMHEIRDAARFDEADRLRHLIAQLRAADEAEIVDHGHALAMTAASGSCGVMGPLLNSWHGPPGVKHLQQLDASLDQAGAPEALGERLARIHERLKAMPVQLVAVGEAAQQGPLAEQLSRIWSAAPAGDAAAKPFSAPSGSGRVAEAWTTSTQVNFCGRAYPTVANRHEDAPALAVLAKLLVNGYLHGAIREQGGAYGAGANYDPDTGSFKFFSYRDPRFAETLADFERSLQWLQDASEARLLEEAILGVIRGLDQPDTPAGEALRAHHGDLHGRDQAFLDWFRQGVLAVTLADLKRVGAKYFEERAANTAVITSAADSAAAERLGLEVKRLS